MLKNKVFLRKTKRGNILKIVREHYLRDDILCGTQACEFCVQGRSDAVLSSQPKIKSSVFPFPHYVVLDTNVILNQIDVLEENAICNIIILSTVLDEVKHRSSSIYKRVKDVIAQKQRRVYVFINEHHKDTYIERLPGESSNDRNDRAIRVATKWYDQHIKKSCGVKEENQIRVVLLTNDVSNRQKAEEDGILAASIDSYVGSLEEYPLLQDKLASKENQFESTKVDLYPLHYPPLRINQELKSGELVQGGFHASRENYLEGSVQADGFEKAILIQGREGLNRAVDGDTVAVKLLPQELWSGPSEVVLQDDEADPGDILEEEDKILPKGSQVVEKQPTGVIVGIIRRKWRQYCGILQVNPIPGSTRHIFVPADRKIPKVRIETRQAQKLASQKIIVAIDSWPRYSRYPQGHFVRALGAIGDIETENEVVLLEHDVPHSKFSQEVLSFLPTMPWTITEEDYKQRVDLRELAVCSVDPPGCTDIDDALHCRDLPNGNLEVGVHIADVSHFIRPGNALDREAASRGTTVYLVGKRIDMVPELLSSNLCSLRGGVERFAFSCVWEMDHESNIISTKFHKSVIKSKSAMTYQEAQCIIDDAKQNHEIAQSLRNLNKLAKLLKKKRIDKGALVLASTEIRFHFDSETQDPINVENKLMLDTNSMVEEFMLLANISVAEHIFKEFPECAMLRRHPPPPQTNFAPLVAAARHVGFEIDTNSGKDLAISLDNAVLPDNPYFNTMLRIVATRCMMQAIYFTSGTVPQEDFFHYGLSAEIYTHFTSPIRRYADIMVHRLLAASIGVDTTYAELLDKKKNSDLCLNLNYRNRMAQHADRASVALNTHLFFRGKKQEEEGYVLFVRKNALQVLIPKFGLEGTIYLKLPGEDKQGPITFTYNEHEHTQTCGNVVFHTFDPVRVRLSLDSTNIQHEKLVFELVEPFIPGFSVPKSDVEMKEEPAEKSEAIPAKKKKSNTETAKGTPQAKGKDKKGKKQKNKN